MKMSSKKSTLKTALCATLGALYLVSAADSVWAENRKDKLELRPAMISKKVTQSLLLDVAVNGHNVVAVGERGHVIVSHDDGNSWIQSQTPVQIMLTAVALPNDHDIWAVGHEGLIMHSPDAGKSWVIQYGYPYMPPAANASAGANNDADAGAGADAGGDAGGDDLLGGGGGGGGAAAGGADQRAGQPLLDVWFRNNKEGMAVGAYGSFLHTDDGGEHWDDWSAKMPNQDQWHLNSLVTGDGQLFYVVGEKGLIMRSDDGGKHWNALQSPYEGSFFGALTGPGVDEVTVFGLQGHLFRSSDKGETWQELKSPTQNTLNSGVFLSGRNVVLVGNSGSILYSKDDGNTFEEQIMNDRLSIVSIQANALGKLIMVGQGGVRLAAPALK